MRDTTRGWDVIACRRLAVQPVEFERVARHREQLRLAEPGPARPREHVRYDRGLARPSRAQDLSVNPGSEWPATSASVVGATPPAERGWVPTETGSDAVAAVGVRTPIP